MSLHIKNINADAELLFDLVYELDVNFTIHRDTFIFYNYSQIIEDKIYEIQKVLEDKNQTILITKGEG